MTHVLLCACIVLCVNCAYILAAYAAAARYGIPLSFRGGGAAVLALGTAVEMAAMQHTDARTFGMMLIAFGAVVVSAACDAACGYVFDALTMPCAAIMFGIAGVFGTLNPFLLGVAACGGSLAFLHLITRGRGLGLGDVKLACCIGGAAGALGGIEALGIAFVLGGAYASILLVLKRAQRGQELRFAPYMAAGMAVVALHGVFS
ncbi:MAG TPA: prepilin peptidase [Candidatus Baltobacteraceae bacterium]|nr:prepilin peptidase [Candidatus Baltobacteraceae bacterium]